MYRPRPWSVATHHGNDSVLQWPCASIVVGEVSLAVHTCTHCAMSEFLFEPFS